MRKRYSLLYTITIILSTILTFITIYNAGYKSNRPTLYIILFILLLLITVFFYIFISKDISNIDDLETNYKHKNGIYNITMFGVSMFYECTLFIITIVTIINGNLL